MLYKGWVEIFNIVILFQYFCVCLFLFIKYNILLLKGLQSGSIRKYEYQSKNFRP